MAKKILVVEDDQDLVGLLKYVTAVPREDPGNSFGCQELHGDASLGVNALPAAVPG